jgi:hypothetical protein
MVRLIAGNGTRGYSGDHGPAQSAQLNEPMDLAMVNGGLLGESYLYIADTGNHVIRRVRLSDHEIWTVAGTGEAGFSRDGGTATEAKLNRPNGIAVRGSNIYISDTLNHRVRMIDATGLITTIAGTGLTGDSGQQVSALSQSWRTQCVDLYSFIKIISHRFQRETQPDQYRQEWSQHCGYQAVQY